MSGNCGGRVGNISKPVIVKYTSKHPKDDTISISRFKVIERFKLPYYNKVSMEFFNLDIPHSYRINKIYLNGKQEINTGICELPFIPDSLVIESYLNEKISFKKTYENLELIKNPEFSFWSQFTFGPTITDRFGVCD